MVTNNYSLDSSILLSYLNSTYSSTGDTGKIRNLDELKSIRTKPFIPSDLLKTNNIIMDTRTENNHYIDSELLKTSNIILDKKYSGNSLKEFEQQYHLLNLDSYGRKDKAAPNLPRGVMILSR